MGDYRCDRCGREYTHREYRGLEKVPVDPDDPERRQGYHSLCECGAEFWRDRWTTVDTFEIDGTEFRVSTVFLTLAHGPNRDQWYETCVFYDGDSRVQDRYTTQEQAQMGHDSICERIRNGRFRFEPTGRRLVIDDAE